MRRIKRLKTPSWYALVMLAVESQQVIAMRLAKITAGGSPAKREARLMVSEKIKAAITAGARIANGASNSSIVDGYRTKVRANIKRLSE